MNVPRLRFKDDDGNAYPAWEDKNLGKILIKFRLGGNYANSETVTNFPLIKMGNLDRGSIKLNKIEYIKVDEVINTVDKINYGDLFFNTRNTLDLVGKVAIWRNELPEAYFNSNLMLLKFDNNFFMNYRLNSNKGIEALRAIATGTTSVAAIYTKDLLKVSLKIPCLKEQTKIANLLTAVDEKIAQLTQKADLLARYKKGVMQQIFSQQLRFKDDDGREFPEWEEVELRDIGSFFSGGTPLTTRKDFYDGEIPFIKSGELSVNSTAQYITELGLKNSSAKMVNVGDLLYALYGATSGELAISKIEGAINQAILCIRTSLNTYYLYSYLLFQKQSILQAYLQGGQGNLSAEIVKSLDVPCPSDKEQTKIANFLTAIDDKISHNQTQLNALKHYKQGLLQQMFV